MAHAIVYGVGAFALMSASAFGAGTLRVPEQHATIQAAIDAASHGDTVVVAPGVYAGPGNRNITTLGKSITLRSENGPESCIIDVGASPAEWMSGFVINSAETFATVIEGFTVMGGYAFNGAGFHISNGGPTIRDCIVTGNYAACWGGGIYTESEWAFPRIENCRVFGNTSRDEGGGAFNISGSPVYVNCAIVGNNARMGAGICNFGGAPSFIGCLIAENVSEWMGGGAYMYYGRIINCTVAGNTGAAAGSGVYVHNSPATIANSIVWGNKGSVQVGGAPSVTFSIVEGGIAGAGNMGDDPLFLNPGAGDFRVLAISPAIDAGANPLVPAGITRDLAGRPRFVDHPGVEDRGVGPGPIVDIGAFEFNPRQISTLLSK